MGPEGAPKSSRERGTVRTRVLLLDTSSVMYRAYYALPDTITAPDDRPVNAVHGYLDMTANLPVVDPTQIQSPVMVVRGQWDGIAIDEDVLDFYQKLPNPDKQFAILPGLAHSLHLGINRHVTWHVAHAFLSMPAPIPVPA